MYQSGGDGVGKRGGGGPDDFDLASKRQRGSIPGVGAPPLQGGVPGLEALAAMGGMVGSAGFGGYLGGPAGMGGGLGMGGIPGMGAPGMMPGMGFPGFGHPGGQPAGPRPFPVVKCRGLPFSCEEIDILEFFSGLDVVDVLMVKKNRRFSGEAFVVFGNAIQMEVSFQRNRMNMGRRYVEIFRAKKHEYYQAVANEITEGGGIAHEGSYSEGIDGEGGRFDGPPPAARYSERRGGGGGASGGGGPPPPAVDHSSVLKLRGLPYSATKQDILDFFEGYDLSESSIHIVTGSDGRVTGEAFVEFDSAEQATAGMEKDRCRIGSRYIELFASSREEATRAATRGL